MKMYMKVLGVITTAVMFLVLVTGARVTNTGSEQGCGRSWPLCHGQFVPKMAVTTAIEFTHRAIVGIASMLIIALAVGGLFLYRNRREMQILAPLMVAFLFVQAGLGAWAVMYPQEAAILALHFGVSLISFASTLLTAVFLFEAEGSERIRDRPLPSLFRRTVWGITFYSYAVVYLGAYVRHASANLACSGWPLCNGSALPALQGHVAANFLHRVAAGVLVLMLVGLLGWTYRLRADRPDVFVAGVIAVGMVLLQSASGAAVVLTRLDLYSALAHAALAGGMFGSLSYLCMHAVPRSDRAVEPVRAVAHPQPAPATARR